MAEYTYYGTKRVVVAGGAYLVHFDKWWDFEAGDLVNLEIRKLSGDGRYIKSVKKISLVGNSKSIFLDKEWGFVPKDIVVIAISKNVIHNDPRIETEEGDQKIPQ